GNSPDRREARQHVRALVKRADRCARCMSPLDAGAVIYRRRAHWNEAHSGASMAFEGNPSEVTAPVQPYCADCRCTQPEGRHNRDAPEGSYYPRCRCDDRYWEEPQPCLGCGRLVAHPKYAAWRGWTEYGRWHNGKEIAMPRTFCGSDCKRRVLAIEARSK